MLRFHTSGIRRLREKMTEAKERSEDMRPAWEDVSDEFHDLEKLQFRTEGALTGGWAALDPAYAARKPAGSILVRSGNLRDAMTNPHHPDVREVMRPMEYERTVTGETGRVADYHQQGTSNMPRRRPLIPIREMFAPAAAELVADHIMEPF